MDPVRTAQRNRWKDTKALPPKWSEMTEFQQKFEQNIHVQALMTPVRQCNITNTHLPSFFLLPLSLVQHDKTKSHTILPVDLYNEVYASDPETTPVTPSIRRRAYIQLRQPLLRYVSRDKKWLRILGHDERMHMKRTSYTGLSWRKDMEEFVMGMLRDLVVRELQPLLNNVNDEAIQSSRDFSQIEKPNSAVFILLHGLPRDRALEEIVPSDKGSDQCSEQARGLLESLVNPMDSTAGTTSTTADVRVPSLPSQLIRPPIDLPNITLAEQKVPVYDLDVLLGEATVAKLFSSEEFGKLQYLVVKKGSKAVSLLHKQLLRLQFFLTAP